VLLFLINAVFRSTGDAAVAMRVLWIANAVNIILGPTLVFGWGPFPKLGVSGAAIGTTIGRSVGVLFALSLILRPGKRIQLKRHHFAFDPGLIVRVVKLSTSATFQVFIGMASWIGMIRIIASFGSAALAGMTIGMRVVSFAMLPSWGMSNAAATMVGQALGAKKPERAESAVWKAGFYNACFLGVIGLSFVLGARVIVHGFTSDPEVARYAVASLRTIALGFLFYAYGMVITQSFNGAGDTRTPTLINLGVFWMFEIPLGWLLAHQFGMGPQGVFIAMTIAFSMLAVVSAALFRRGEWKSRTV
jgi:putative MATE family efflux protein